MIDYEVVKKAYKDALKGNKKYKKEAILFDRCREGNLIRLWNELNGGTYEVGEYIKFKVYEPKEREVSAPHFRDKIVQFILHYKLEDTYKKKFIKGSFACLKEKGTHRAVKHLWKAMRLCKNKGHIIKVDVRKFFYSIDREILKEILKKKIKSEFYLDLLFQIIDSSPEGKRGIPLGNVTSQDFANIYLNELDQYCVRYLGVKHYTRYMDDVVIVIPGDNSLERAKEILEKIKTFLSDRLNLETNEKTHIFPIAQGVNAFGFKIFSSHILVRDKSKRAMKRRMRAMDKKLKEEKIELEEVKQSVNAWLGHARHSNSYNLAKKIFEKYDYINVEGDEYFGTILRNG